MEYRFYEIVQESGNRKLQFLFVINLQDTPQIKDQINFNDNWFIIDGRYIINGKLIFTVRPNPGLILAVVA